MHQRLDLDEPEKLKREIVFFILSQIFRQSWENMPKMEVQAKFSSFSVRIPGKSGMCLPKTKSEP